MDTLNTVSDSTFLLQGIIIGGIAFLIGGGLALILWNFALKRKSKSIVSEAKAEAEVIKKDKNLQAKEKFFQLKSEHERYINERNNRLSQSENKFKQRENSLLQKIDEAQRTKRDQEAIRENLNNQLELVNKKGDELSKMHKQQVEQLEAISGLSGEEAKSQLIESLKDEAKSEAISYVNEIMDEAKMTANREAKKVVIESIQRVATETAIENAVTVFNIESDEIKGRIIGR